MMYIVSPKVPYSGSSGDIVISLLLLLASIVLVALLSVRIYSASVLRYGQRIRLKDMFKLSS